MLRPYKQGDHLALTTKQNTKTYLTMIYDRSKEPRNSKLSVKQAEVEPRGSGGTLNRSYRARGAEGLTCLTNPELTGYFGTA